MAAKSWTLTDQQHQIDIPQFSLDPSMVGGAVGGYSILKRTLQAGRSRGVDLVEVDNGRARVTVIPTRGMGIWQATVGDMRLGWRSPVQGPVHPGLVQLGHADGLGWLDGFDEFLCRCGLESNGAPVFDDSGRLVHGLHGKIANTPAHRVDVSVDGDTGELSVHGVVDEARLFGNKMRLESTVSTRVGQPGFTITDTITNISAEPGDLELLYHTNYGVPLLEPGARLHLPVERLAPHTAVAQEDLPTWHTYGPEWPGSAESNFLAQLVGDGEGNTMLALHNKAADRGAVMRFNINELPRFTIWKSRQAAVDGYVTGLEPGLNYPNPKPFERQHGRVVELQPGESRTCRVTIEALPDASAVEAAVGEVEKLQSLTKPQIDEQPNPDWSAG